jgi:hypothetical protein
VVLLVGLLLLLLLLVPLVATPPLHACRVLAAAWMPQLIPGTQRQSKQIRIQTHTHTHNQHNTDAAGARVDGVRAGRAAVKV